MLFNSKGKEVKSLHRGRNHIQEGFVVSHKADQTFLAPLHEVHAVLAPHCGKMFQLGTRARMKGA